MRKVNIGVVYSPSAPNMESIICSLQGLGELSFILPGSRSAKYDIIIIPDGGVNPNLRTFTNGSYQALPMAPICPFIERFREQILPIYLEKDISIIGLGDSRIIIWDILGFKTAVTSLGTKLLTPNEIRFDVLKKNLDEIEDFESSYSETAILAGFKTISPRLTSCLLKQVKRISKAVTSIVDEGDNTSAEFVDEAV